MSDESVVPMLRRNVNDKEYRRVRRLWMEHSSAEDQHNIPV